MSSPRAARDGSGSADCDDVQQHENAAPVLAGGSHRPFSRALSAVGRLRGGSFAGAVSLSARGLQNVRIKDSDNDFTFMVGNRAHRCSSFVAEFLSPLVAELRAADGSIREFRVEVDGARSFFSDFLSLGRGCTICVDPANRAAFLGICTALRNCELCELLCGDGDNELTVENAADRLLMRCARECDISAQVEFVASHFCDIVDGPNCLGSLPFSVVAQIVGHPNLRLATEDSLFGFISRDLPAGDEFLSLLEFVRFEYCTAETMDSFFHLISEDFHRLNISLWASLHSRLVLPVSPACDDERVADGWRAGSRQGSGQTRKFIPLIKTETIRPKFGREDVSIEAPDGIIAHLTRECGGNVHEANVVEVTASSTAAFTQAKDAADLNTDSCFVSACHYSDVPNAPNNWLRYDFKNRRIVPTHYAIRTTGNSSLRSWLVETSLDGEHWVEIDHKENNAKLNGYRVTKTFAVRAAGKCRYIRLVNVGSNHQGNDCLSISAFEIFGKLSDGTPASN
jgi:hypothetical protein